MNANDALLLVIAELRQRLGHAEAEIVSLRAQVADLQPDPEA